MKSATRKQTKHRSKDDAIYVLMSKWETVDEYSEEEIEDLFDEYNIPEVSYIEKIEKPEEIIFD